MNKEELYKIIIDKLYTNMQASSTVVNWLMETFDYKLAASYRLIQDAKKFFAEHIEKLNTDALGETLEILKKTREHAEQEGNWKIVLEVSKEIAKLNQLYIEKQELNIKTEQPLFGFNKKDLDI